MGGLAPIINSKSNTETGVNHACLLRLLRCLLSMRQRGHWPPVRDLIGTSPKTHHHDSAFLRTQAAASRCCNCSPRRCSALSAQRPKRVLPKRRLASIKRPSTWSALFKKPAALAVISRMVCQRSSRSGCARDCSIRWSSWALNAGVREFYSEFSFVIPLMNDLAKFVHSMLQQSLLSFTSS